MLSVRFDNLEEVKQFYDPIIVEKAARTTIKQLHGQAATLISKAIREKHNVTVRDVKSALHTRIKTTDGVETGSLIYTGKRISLRHFATAKSSPLVSTARFVKGTRRKVKRRGVRVKDRKDSRARIVPGAFWGRAAIGSGAGKIIGEGTLQIFQRIGLSRLKIRKLTGPAIAQMAGGEAPLDAINELMREKADKTLAHNLDHFLRTKTGIR